MATLAIAVMVWGTMFLSPQRTLATTSCQTGTNFGEIRGHSSAAPTHGAKASIYVNDFNTHQVDTWRDTIISQNSNNNAEVGWFTDEAYGDQLAHPYKTWLNNSEYHNVDFDGRNITPRAQEHVFEVKETNTNNEYRFLLDGDQLGTDETATIDNGLSNANANTERHCDDDSLWATFDYLKRQSSRGGAWNLWPDIDNSVNRYNAPYHYCAVSSSAFNVKQDC